jgi:DNA-binding MarR family transcriptional regulator
MNNELKENNLSEKAKMASILSNAKAMRIFLFISEDTEKLNVYCLQEIADGINISKSTTYLYLQRLVKAGLIEKETPRCDKRERYYGVLNQTLAQK